MTPDQFDQLLALLRQLSTTSERQAEALERIAERLESSDPLPIAVTDIHQEAINSLVLVAGTP
jgi:hypothetical protein